MADEDGSETECLQDIFTDPWRPPTPEATFARYVRYRDENDSKDSSSEEVAVRLVGSHPLWGHYLWNASVAVAEYLESHRDLVRGRFVLELGAGGGLPGIVSAQIGAKKVVLTDYPDQELIDNLTYNVDHNVSPADRTNIDIQGYIWGHKVQGLLAALPSTRDGWRAFDLIILSDLVFNHSQHDALLRTCELSLTPLSGQPCEPPSSQPAPCVLVFYTHHRPHLAHRDLDFFTKARSQGWICEEIVTRKFPPMFPDDPGDEEVRATVHGWRLVRGTSKVETAAA
ncbi:putative methyltransferase-domain-containing protein [Pisolithus orientalis]|uniref:putative methyltransferase-domain-containing protein n=1 Tax=Pisolithus orientalis TaxID=936130 RepID=UPI002225B2C1|nr:putative methyltransferase-domain-containing protein [Pisolithus orientalis]KAI6015328.1 putative methyltransferase-domain-containing protein [Pisolithus orientalis]